MVEAVWNGAVIARSDRTVVVEGNHYFPPEDVDESKLTQSELTSVCGWKGTARYYNVVAEGQTNKDAAWYYPEPKEAASEIAGYIAFWKGVKVSGSGGSESAAGGQCAI